MPRLLRTKVALHRAGAVVGGTSAGAAVLSAEMITGEADLKSLKSGTTVLKKGLGLLRDVIVDQLRARRRVRSSKPARSLQLPVCVCLFYVKG